MRPLGRMRFFRQTIVWLAIMAVVWNVQAVYGVSARDGDEEVFVHGTISVAARPAMGTYLDLKVGDTAVITIDPYVHIQYEGCNKVDCPQRCGAYDCFTPGVGCGCGEKTPKRYETEAIVRSGDSNVVTVENGPVLQREPDENTVGDKVSADYTLTAVKAGETTISVKAECRDWTSVTKKFTVVVTDSSDSPGPSAAPEQPEPSAAPEQPEPSAAPDQPESPESPEDQEPPLLDSGTATVTMNGSGKVTFGLSGAAQDWADHITVYVDDEKIDSCSASTSKLTIPTTAFTKAKRASYNLKVEAPGYKDFTAQVTVNNYGAERLYIRLLDASGKVKNTKTYTKDEIVQLSDAEDIYYQTVCSMRGISSYKAKGVYLKTLLEKAGISFNEGMTLKLRTNDKASVNDPSNEDAYYDEEKGVFSYEDLMQTTRYAFPEIYTNETLKDNLLNKAGKFDEAMRTFLAGSRKTEVQPMLAYTYTTNLWNSDPDNDMSEEEYSDAVTNERAFKLLFGVAMDAADPDMISGETTTWNAAYCVFGIDIQEKKAAETPIPSVTASPEVGAPGKVTLKSAVSAGYNSVKLSWTKTAKATGYRIYRTASKNGKYTLVQTVNSANTITYTDSKGLISGKTYYYRVSAIRKEGTQTAEGQLSVYRSAKPIPGKVTVKTAKRNTAKKATIQWKKVSGASGYIVYRANSKNGRYKSVKTIKSASKLKYISTGLKKGKAYYYKVQAYRTVSGKKVKGVLSTAQKVKAKR